VDPEPKDPAGAAAPAGSGVSSVCGDAIDSPVSIEPAPKKQDPHAVRAAKLELLREAIFENLGAVQLFAETAKLLIEARDDTGMAHAIKMGAHHYRAAVVTAKELASLKAEGIR
jgi:hypothetical protein